jgi:hypothetical protein
LQHLGLGLCVVLRGELQRRDFDVAVVVEVIEPILKESARALARSAVERSDMGLSSQDPTLAVNASRTLVSIRCASRPSTATLAAATPRGDDSFDIAPAFDPS